MPRTLVQTFVGDVRLVVRRAARPSADEFDDHVSVAAARSESTRVVLIAFVGDGEEIVFDAEQRAKLCKAGLFSKPHAVLAPPIRPDLLLSQKWLGARIRSFPADAFDAACDFLEVAPDRRAKLYDLLSACKTYLGGGGTDVRVEEC